MKKMQLEFTIECPNCLEKNKIVSKCLLCNKWCCNLCSNNYCCINCYIDKNKKEELSIYFEDKVQCVNQ